MLANFMIRSVILVLGFFCVVSTAIGAAVSDQPKNALTIQSAMGAAVQPGRDDAVYYELPVVGEFGKEIQASTIEKGIRAAKTAKATHLVLILDTPGGDISALQDALAVMGQEQDLHFVAFVKQAGSSGAILALACRQIIMSPQGVIGSAVPFDATPGRSPRLLKEKQFAFIAALFRSASEMGHHDSLFARGMCDGDLVVSVVKTNQGVKLVEDTAGSQGTVLKRKGKILCLSANEAAEYGLSCGTARSAADAQQCLGVSAWRSVGSAAGWIDTVVRSNRTKYYESRIKDVQAAWHEIDGAIAQANNRLAEIDREIRSSNALQRNFTRTMYSSEIERLQSRITDLTTKRTEWVELQRRLVRGDPEEHVLDGLIHIKKVKG